MNKECLEHAHTFVHANISPLDWSEREIKRETEGGRERGIIFIKRKRERGREKEREM